MNITKIGCFINEQRKAKGLTQAELANKLYISDKTVSKWERGVGLPDIDLMMPLCNELGITINELLSGCKIDSKEYKDKAEEALVDLVKEREQAKRKILLSFLSVAFTFIPSLCLMMFASFVDMKAVLRIVLILIGMISITGGIVIACIFDYQAGAYKCIKCGHVFVPKPKDYIMSPHTFKARKLKCPCCGEKSYCRRTLTK